jgi:hypothetical protein
MVWLFFCIKDFIRTLLAASSNFSRILECSFFILLTSVSFLGKKEVVQNNVSSQSRMLIFYYCYMTGTLSVFTPFLMDSSLLYKLFENLEFIGDLAFKAPDSRECDLIHYDLF